LLLAPLNRKQVLWAEYFKVHAQDDYFMHIFERCGYRESEMVDICLAIP
jgi:hypothetical protein